MFAAMSENLDFFKPKINLAIMLAPVARVDRLSSSTLQKLKDNKQLLDFFQKMGPEMLPNPQIDGKVSSGFMKMTGLHSFSIGLLSDEDPAKNLSEGALQTFMGHFPAGTSFRSVNHFRQLTLGQEFKKYDFGI